MDKVLIILTLVNIVTEFMTDGTQNIIKALSEMKIGAEVLSKSIAGPVSKLQFCSL